MFFFLIILFPMFLFSFTLLPFLFSPFHSFRQIPNGVIIQATSANAANETVDVLFRQVDDYS
jgi:hypothetical protein